MTATVTSEREAELVPLHEQLTEAFHRHGDRVALLAGADRFTFADLDAAVGAYCVRLRAAGLRAGQRMAVMGMARPQFVIAVLATLRLGASVVLVSPAWKSLEVQHAVQLTGPAVAASDRDHLHTLRGAFTGPVLDLDDVPLRATVPPVSPAPFEQLAPDDWAGSDAALVFSSGTTGLPKAVLHTHATVGAATRHWATALGLSETDRFQIATPPSHILGLLNIFAAISSGSTIRLHTRFDVDEMLRCIEADRLTLEMTVAPIALALAEHAALERFDLSSLRYFMWCATPVVPAVAGRVTARTGVRFITAYGASELPLISSANPASAAPDSWRIDTAGRVIDPVSVRVVDPESGAALKPGIAGEIQARGRSMMVGYLPADANDDAFVDGWYRTGDIGWVDTGGWLHITDRLKEMVKVKGFQVAPAEVESTLLGHPAVLDCAVYGVPDAITGEAVVAAVVADPEQPVTEADLRDLVRASLAKYKTPSRIAFVEAIPRTPSGKVLRRVLRDQQPVTES